LLAKRSPLQITVFAIAKAAGSSPATFYVYFTDVKDVLLALCEMTREDLAPICKMLEGPWPSNNVVQRAKDFVEAYYAFWHRHRRLLAVRDLEAKLGDERFEDERVHAVAPILHSLANRIREARGLRNLSYEDAWAEAVVSCAAMDQLFSYSTQGYRRPETPINVNHVLRAETEIISRLLAPPGSSYTVRTKRPAS
jgi:AcrR family transcriptional regulator